jgi:heat shock protein HtpX
MAFMKRIFLFLLVNLLIMTTVSLVAELIITLLGRNATIAPEWVIFYGVLGFGGALMSLALSRQTAKWMLGVQVIDPGTAHADERRLLEMVYGLARRAGLPAMPEVGIYDSPEVNAFATGPTKRRSLVAVSTGLLGKMDWDSLDGVLGHEITHVANGDMVTMTLLQGLINTMVLILARLVAIVASNAVEERARDGVRLIAYIFFQFVFSLLGSLIVCYFSRWREYRADAGGARLAGRERMLSGLRSLRQVYGEVDEHAQSLASLKINGQSTRSLMALFATHPPLEDRIRRLETMPI